jgi:crotonobetainyl-CoA hydratase
LIVATDHAQFFLTEARLGILPDAGSVKLGRLLPRHLARELMMTGRRMSAEEAARWGLASRVVPLAELRAAALALADEVAAAAPLSLAALLDIERRTAHLPTAEAMRLLPTLDSYRRCIDSADAAEGTTAFNERRPAIWAGQ